MAASIKDPKTPAEKEAWKTQYVVEENLETRNESIEQSIVTTTNRRKSTITNDIIEKSIAEEIHAIEDEINEESEDEGIEDFYIASRKVTNQVEEERDSLKDELRMMRDNIDSLKKELKREKKEKEGMRCTVTSIKKERDNVREELRAIKLEREEGTDADKYNKPVDKSNVRKTIRTSSWRKASGSKLNNSEDKVEDNCSEFKTDPEKPGMAHNKRVECDQKKIRRQSIATPSAVKRTNCKFGDSCQGCPTPECQVCIFCLDRPSRGGKNKLKQKCLERKCRSDEVPESLPEEQVGTESVELSCEECSQDFRRKEQLKRHMIKTHGA